MLIDDKYNKRLPTESELRVLGSFPPGYNFGELSFNEVWQLIGNAVIPDQTEVIGHYLWEKILSKV
jgi:site-specific DNA-cytosine methylase